MYPVHRIDVRLGVEVDLSYLLALLEDEVDVDLLREIGFLILCWPGLMSVSVGGIAHFLLMK